MSDGSIIKAEIARRQLGTALSLYLRDRDPVSVHCLACGGCEIAEQLAIKAGGPPFVKFALECHPQMSDRDLKTLRDQFWNAFKHANGRNGVERDDSSLLADFSESENESRLFAGWMDYGTATQSLPIEAQVFTTWFFALHPPTVMTEEVVELIPLFEAEFPNLASLPHDRQKQRLRRAIQKWNKNQSLLDDSRTDRRPLMLGSWRAA